MGRVPMLLHGSFALTMALLALPVTPREARAAEGPGKPAAEAGDKHSATADRSVSGGDEERRREESFRTMVTNAALSGHFVMDGAAEDGELRTEEYVITSATKLGHGDLWLLTSRIRYGDVDLTVPVPVQVKWAGDTPVITVDNVGIPGLGTFSARVVLDRGRYAGTWTHDKVGGHMFGRIVPAAEADADKSAPARTTESAGDAGQ